MHIREIDCALFTSTLIRKVIEKGKTSEIWQIYEQLTFNKNHDPHLSGSVGLRVGYQIYKGKYSGGIITNKTFWHLGEK